MKLAVVAPIVVLIVLLGTLAGHPQLALGQTTNPEAQTQAALLLLQSNPKAALPLLQQAAIQNHPEAQYYLGQVLLADVQNTPQAQLAAEVAEGLRWLLRAAQNQYTPAQLLYAQLVLESPQGRPMQHQPAPALDVLLDCTQHTSPWQPRCVAYAYQYLRRQVPSNLLPNSNPKPNPQACQAEPACMQLQSLQAQAAQQGHPQASLDLAINVLNNQATLGAEDPALLKLLTTAAKAGLVEAQTILGQALIEGTRLPKNTALGSMWLNKAVANSTNSANSQAVNSQSTNSKTPATPHLDP